VGQFQWDVSATEKSVANFIAKKLRHNRQELAATTLELLDSRTMQG
jgi:hypothetical protein